MRFDRASGVLLHPTSLPGSFGIGDLGPEAYRWIDFLSSAGCTLWQVLPLGPTGYGDSPYQSFSAFGGNQYLISPEILQKEELLHPNDLLGPPEFPEGRVDYGSVIAYKIRLIDRAFQQFHPQASPSMKTEFEEFLHKESFWLDDFALFMTIKDFYGGKPWVKWSPEHRSRDPQAIQRIRNKYSKKIDFHIFHQFLFFRQWNNLHKYAHEMDIQIMGDIPIFIAHDSSDVWANPDLFFLDSHGNPTVVAGVPPDYFSPTGQLWGNPLYRWEEHSGDGFKWWIKRFRSVLSIVDIVRLDHFRGFLSYWEIPANEETAVNGHWVPGPGAALFQTITNVLGDLPIIAEDLGVITPEVTKLRDDFNFPGMKILLFAFDSDSNNPFLPHNYSGHTVVYTGTHDNDTTLGWFQRTSGKERDYVLRYLASDGKDICWDLIRSAWASVSALAITPMQDLLRLDNNARMNYPSKPSGNWIWRTPKDYLNPSLLNQLAELNSIYGRDGKGR